MEDLTINADKVVAYGLRMQKSILICIAFGFIFFVLGTIIKDLEIGLAVGGLTFLVQIIKSLRRNRFYITSISAINNSVNISYLDRNSNRIANGLLSDFEFKKKLGFSRAKIPYLEIYKNGNFLLHQYMIGEWNEKLIDSAIDKFK